MDSGAGRRGVGRSAVNVVSVRVRDEHDLGVVRAEGELDMSTVPELHRVLGEQLRRGLRGVVVDLSGVSFIGASGLGVLAEGQDAAAEAGVALRVVARGRAVRRPMAVIGLDRSVAVFDSLSEAVESLSGGVEALEILKVLSTGPAFEQESRV